MRKYKGEVLSPPEELTKVSKIHFLIHPGFMLAYNSIEKPMPEHLRDMWIELLEAYVNKSEELGPDEVMLIFLPHNFNITKIHTEYFIPKYLEIVQRIKQILKNRAIFFTENFGVRNPQASDVEKLKKLIKSRGFTFDDNVLSEGYGEMIDWCVQQGITNLHKKLRLKNKTKIVTKLTDARFYPDFGDRKSSYNKTLERNNAPYYVD